MRCYLGNIFLRSVIFPYNSLYTQAVAYTTYFELGEPVVRRAKREKMAAQGSGAREARVTRTFRTISDTEIASPTPPYWSILKRFT